MVRVLLLLDVGVDQLRLLHDPIAVGIELLLQLIRRRVDQRAGLRDRNVVKPHIHLRQALLPHLRREALERAVDGVERYVGFDHVLAVHQIIDDLLQRAQLLAPRVWMIERHPLM